jgi:aminomethyltransferase
MPVQYSSIREEHLAVRNAVGIFDISHMGEVLVSGPAAGVFLNQLLTNDISALRSGQAQYTLMCNERGGVIDDLYAYQIGDASYLLVVNASRTEADLNWLQRQWNSFPQRDQVQIADRSQGFCAVAVQGPRAASLMDACFPFGLALKGGQMVPTDLRRNQITAVGLSLGNSDCGGFVARTGYTGEDGFEILAPSEIIEALWNKLLNLGSVYGIKPAGLGARDTLRTEMGYPLYGHELDEETSPMEAGLGHFVALDKPAFVGRSVLAKQKTEGTTKKCVAFKMTGKSAPPRPGYPICLPGGKMVGEVVSGTQSPSLDAGIGMGYMPSDRVEKGMAIEIEIRGNPAPALLVSKPFYKKAV